MDLQSYSISQALFLPGFTAVFYNLGIIFFRDLPSLFIARASSYWVWPSYSVAWATLLYAFTVVFCSLGIISIGICRRILWPGHNFDWDFSWYSIAWASFLAVFTVVSHSLGITFNWIHCHILCPGFIFIGICCCILQPGHHSFRDLLSYCMIQISWSSASAVVFRTPGIIFIGIDNRIL